jgi:hypothetical protein
MDKKSCVRETQEKGRKSSRYIVVWEIPTKKIEYKYIVVKTKENKGTNLWENPRQKRVPKGI